MRSGQSAPGTARSLAAGYELTGVPDHRLTDVLADLEAPGVQDLGVDPKASGSAEVGH